MELKPEILELLQKLEEKYNATGQDIQSYLEGLLYTDYVTYWDYIQTDTLLSLQKPRTQIPDEEIFIMYHQVTELYFKLVMHELKQIASKENLDATYMTSRVTRMNRYFETLTQSFAIMIDGMEVEQFLKFRMALLPASGFQSAQYRMIEILSTDFIHLVGKDFRANYSQNASVAEMYEKIYWKAGATELATGKKTHTLIQFEQKYSETFIQLGEAYRETNLWRRYQSIADKTEALTQAMKEFDMNVNVRWPMVHMKSAARYLRKNPEDIKATGGTNWQKYLSPPIQRRIFYPELWTAEELESWGRP
ncbi:MAG: tryptophan 2,3-dioxygenase family protein [Bacteroidota bacterium]|nr:tryptophan 2,3-dioxygenase family protein [Bacteroidota bacterium]MDX5429692.1 tryptophan 2,3-dioxygenase family protein [Bacteroidota bacterium]MDX5468473.1 tryptophan 2,3-dioxygenase family protein [Bacteroidota bacterium]